MLEITIKNYLSTGLNPEFENIKKISIPDDAFGGGGFGKVYHCQEINGKSVKSPQVVKILLENGMDSHIKGYQTIQKLQNKVRAKHQELSQKEGKGILDVYPALLGIPQFSFVGTLKGKEVYGYSANNLVSLGFTEFKKVLEDDDLLDQYNALDEEDQRDIAYELVSAFDLLREFYYIHADFKADALFVNLQDLDCAIIDFDSGVVLENFNDKPTTFGTKQEWLAPEIMRQIETGNLQKPINVDLNSDVWSVLIGIHYLFFTWHPLFFLTEISDRSIKEYFGKYEWPNVDAHFAYFNKEHEILYKTYVDYLEKSFPEDFCNHFKVSINKGYGNPTVRTSYGTWKHMLKGKQKGPEIEFFTSSSKVVVSGYALEFSWKVNNAIKIVVDGQSIPTSQSSLILYPLRTKKFLLRAENKYDYSEAIVEVTVLPAQKPDIDISLPEITIPSLAINQSIEVPNFNLEIKIEPLPSFDLSLESFTLDLPELNIDVKIPEFKIPVPSIDIPPINFKNI